MNRALSIGYSPCPNDTFIFYALMHGKIKLREAAFAAPLLADVETLNSRALDAGLDVTKLSFHALGHVLDDYVMLTAGAALGRGCGPLLVTKKGRGLSDKEQWKIAIPGKYTTAAMLLALYAPQCRNTVVMRFNEIMSAIVAGEVDAGVIIHESRFTYRQQGLECVQDLGSWWEETTGLPIPLGCIAARRSFPHSLLVEIDEAIRASILWAQAAPGKCSGYIKQHAQELEDSVISSHVGLYVNDFSVRIGTEGMAAVEELFRRGREPGIFPKAAGLSLSI